jgi:SAM-dependent methyltransferase
MQSVAKCDRIDFGSGFNPHIGYATCDPFHPMADVLYDTDAYRMEMDDMTAGEILCRNVLHHVRDLDRLFAEFARVLRPGGIVTVVEPRAEAFETNVFLDRLWYRGLIPRPEVWIAEEYRDYAAVAARHGFRTVGTVPQGEKEKVTLRRLPMNNETIAKELEERGFDYAVAVATNAEVEAGAACGQLAIITEEEQDGE